MDTILSAVAAHPWAYLWFIFGLWMLIVAARVRLR